MKTAKLLWSLGSLLVNVTIGIYIYLTSKAPTEMSERYAYINENWSAFSAHWKVEFVLMTMITIGAIYFASKFRKVSWSIISVGQIILLLTYPIMLAGYRNTPFEIAEMSNQIAVIVFVFGNIVFLLGVFHLYLNDEQLAKWIRYIAIAFSGIAAFAFILSFSEVIDWRQAIMVAPLINIIYLINAYYGFKLKVE